MAGVDSEDLERRLQLHARELDFRISQQTGDAAAQMREHSDELTRLVQEKTAESVAHMQEQRSEILAETDRRWKRRLAIWGPVFGATLTVIGVFGLPTTLEDLKESAAKELGKSLQNEVDALNKEVSFLRGDMRDDIIQIQVQTKIAKKQAGDLTALGANLKSELEKVETLADKVVSYRKDIEISIAEAKEAANDAKKKIQILNRKLKAASNGDPVVYRFTPNNDDPNWEKITASGANLGECCDRIKFTFSKLVDGKFKKMADHDFRIVERDLDADDTLGKALDRKKVGILARKRKDNQLEIVLPKGIITGWDSGKGTNMFENWVVTTKAGILIK